MKILMVCLGNICRSPLAEGILQQKAIEKGLDWQVDSAGTGAWHTGATPDTRSVEVANKYGIDISAQRARQIKVADFDYFDRIYAMDAENYNNIRRLARTDTDRDKVELILNAAWPNQNRQVPDPYYGGADGFEAVFEMLDIACGAVVDAYFNQLEYNT